jgi:glycosyltransferase involved in cell wall biosynthesis
MRENKFTIVTVTYNSANFLEATILSIINQSHSNIEYIIIDGGSTDGTVDIIKQHADSLAYWISEPDKGIYDAMNKAVAVATGNWINFMNSGDKFATDDVLMDVNRALCSLDDADVLYGNALVKYSKFSSLFKIHPIQTIWKHSPFCHQAAFIKTSLMKEYKYDLQYKIGADHDLFFRAYKANKKFFYLNLVVCLFDGRQGATKKWILRAIQDKKDIALKYEYSTGKWIYYQFYLVYINFVLVTKRILGESITGFITGLLKKPRKLIIKEDED